jgi:hypothetical protein
VELGVSVLTRRDRLERIASAERDRRAGRVDLAVASLGEGAEWPARVVLALTRLPDAEGDETREILESSLDAWAVEAGLPSLAEALSASEEEDPSLSLNDGLLAAEEEFSEAASPNEDLDTPIENFELEAAFAQAEAQVDEMHDANQVAERVLMDEPLGLAELSGDVVDVDTDVHVHVEEPASHEDVVRAADALGEEDEELGVPNRTDAAWGEAPIWPTPGVAENSELFDVSAADDAPSISPPTADRREMSDESSLGGRPSREVILATLDRWLVNLETHSARRTQ